jgi:hypothetical protein
MATVPLVPPDPGDFLTIEYAAACVPCSWLSLRRMVADGTGPRVVYHGRGGRRMRFPRRDFERWLAKRQRAMS